ncbi:MAG TPA: TonB-dependent receptor plug domain-containing protein, partial [Caulobacteraceae bacterium]
MAAAVTAAGAPDAPKSQPPPAEAAVTAFPAAFFAASQPSTALDMVGRVPGFILDVGGGVRGFGGAAGNVLIDGARPPAKGDSLDQILSRIPASSVLRIDLIRAGAPGIDMQGKTVLADVIRRKDVGGKATLTLTGTHAYDGRVSGQFHLDAEKRIGAVDLQGSLLAIRALDDGAGTGTWNRVFANGARIQALNATQGHENNYKATGALEAPVLGGSLKVAASVLVDPYHDVQRDTLIPPPGEDFDHFFNRNDTAEIGVRFERPLAAKLGLETYLLQQFGRQHTTDDFTSDPVTAALTGDDVSDHFALRKTTGESIARALVKYAPVHTLSLQAGLEGDFNWLNTRTTFIQNGAPVALPAANVKVTELRGEAFATAVWQARPSLSVEAGLRMEASRIASTGDVISARTLAYPKPRLVLSWSPDSADQLRLRVEREIG